MSDQRPPRRTVVISDGNDAVPGTGGVVDPLLVGPPVAVPTDDTLEQWARELDATPGTSTVEPVKPQAEPQAAGPAPAGTGEAAGTGTELPAPASTPAARPTKVIVGDDDLPDATYTVQAARTPEQPGQMGPRVDPRMKARRLAVRQAAGRRRLWWLVGFGVVAVLGLAALALFSSSLFDIRNVQVTGAANSDPAQIAEITDDLLGKATLTADLDAIERRLMALPWVEYAEVRSDFPHTVYVDISERTPVAAFQSADTRWRVIDLDGRVIDVLAGRPIDYVAIFGPGPDKIAGESAAEYAPVAQLITALPPLLRPAVIHFTVDEAMSVTMTMNLSGRADGQLTEVELCAAEALDVQQLVALTAFIQTKVNPDRGLPSRISACDADLITTSDATS